MLKTPESLREEHKEIMGALRSFSKSKSKTGAALRQLLKVLEPHFEKEEKLTMPVLGSLADLALNKNSIELKEIADSREPLRKEYDAMLSEHGEIRKFVEIALKAAKQESRQDVSDLLEGLMHHARVEEEVLYPAALLAGNYASILLNTTTGTGKKILSARAT